MELTSFFEEYETFCINFNKIGAIEIYREEEYEKDIMILHLEGNKIYVENEKIINQIKEKLKTIKESKKEPTKIKNYRLNRKSSNIG